MKIAIILTAMDRMSKVVGGAVSKSVRQLAVLDKAAKSIDSFGNKALIAGGIGTAFFGTTISAAEESEVATNRLRQVFKSMGQDYNEATKQSEEYASKLQSQIGVEDEMIMAVQAKLATFEKAANAQARANGVFNRAAAASFDMQAAGFGEAAGNAVQLGKALQDPIKGITALRKSGITFTEAEQKKIKALVKSNKIFEAQNMVMKAIEKQVGGVASSTVTESRKMRIAWGEVQETIGKQLLPAFTKIATFISDTLIPRVQGFIEKHPELTKWLAISSVALLAIGGVAKIVSFAISAMAGVFGFAVKAIRIVGITVMWLGRLLLANPIILIITAITVGVYLIIKNWSKIRAFFIRLWNGIKNVFRMAFKIIMDISLAPARAVIFVWEKLRTFFSNLWDGIKSMASEAWTAIKNFITAPIVWIQEQWEKLGNFFENLWKKMKGWAKDVFGWIANVTTGGGIANVIIEKQIEAKKAQEAAKSAGNGGPSFWERISKSTQTLSTPVAVASRGDSITLNYSPTINGSGEDKAGIVGIFKKHQMEIMKMMQEAQRKKDRTKF